MHTILGGPSIEMIAKDADRLGEAAALLPRRTEVSITFLPDENIDARVAAAVAARDAGLVPVPHISARRLASQAELDEFLERLTREAAVDRVFAVAGDAAKSAGLYPDALALIGSGMFERHAIRHVGIAGYPEGHPDIPRAALWTALAEKQEMLAAMGLGTTIVTQFGFAAAPILAWLSEVRDRGISAPVRIGVPGPASARTLLRFAARCGVGASAKAMAKYGLSLTQLLNAAGPDRLLGALSEGLVRERHGEARLHFYPFGGLVRTAAWIRQFREAGAVPGGGGS